MSYILVYGVCVLAIFNVVIYLCKKTILKSHQKVKTDDIQTHKKRLARSKLTNDSDCRAYAVYIKPTNSIHDEDEAAEKVQFQIPLYLEGLKLSYDLNKEAINFLIINGCIYRIETFNRTNINSADVLLVEASYYANMDLNKGNKLLIKSGLTVLAGFKG